MVCIYCRKKKERKKKDGQLVVFCNRTYFLFFTGGQTISPEQVTQDDLASYIDAANAAVSPFDLEIRSILSQKVPTGQVNGNGNQANPERIFALVNTTSDPLMQLATTYSADEIAFVKRLLDAMFDTYNTRRLQAMVVSATQAIQLARVTASEGSSRRESQGGGQIQALSMTQAETVLKSLVQEGWLEMSRKGYYSLTPRALIELRTWLVSMYNEDGEADRIKFCAACREIVTVGQRCAKRECPGRLHDMCMRNVFRVQQAEKCPVCKEDWPGNQFVGERAITMADR